MKKLLTLLFVLGLLAGCSVVHKPGVHEEGIANERAWDKHQEVLQDFDSWSLQGRVATGQMLGWTGNLSWRERDGKFDVRLSGPLGSGGMRARGTLDKVLIHTDDGQQLETSEPDELIRETLGWTFPLQPLSHWARGLPAP